MLGKKLGEGSFGVVYESNKSNDEGEPLIPVAIKVIIALLRNFFIFRFEVQ